MLRTPRLPYLSSAKNSRETSDCHGEIRCEETLNATLNSLVLTKEALAKGFAKP